MSNNELKRYNIKNSINNNSNEIKKIDKMISDNYTKIKNYHDCKSIKKVFFVGVILSLFFFSLAILSIYGSIINSALFTLPFVIFGTLSTTIIVIPKLVRLIIKKGFKKIDICELNKLNEGLYEIRNDLIKQNNYAKEELEMIEKNIEDNNRINDYNNYNNSYNNDIIHEDIKIYVRKK